MGPVLSLSLGQATELTSLCVRRALVRRLLPRGHQRIPASQSSNESVSVTGLKRGLTI